MLLSLHVLSCCMARLKAEKSLRLTPLHSTTPLHRPPLHSSPLHSPPLRYTPLHSISLHLHSTLAARTEAAKSHESEGASSSAKKNEDAEVEGAKPSAKKYEELYCTPLHSTLPHPIPLHYHPPHCTLPAPIQPRALHSTPLHIDHHTPAQSLHSLPPSPALLHHIPLHSLPPLQSIWPELFSIPCCFKPLHFKVSLQSPHHTTTPDLHVSRIPSSRRSLTLTTINFRCGRHSRRLRLMTTLARSSRDRVFPPLSHLSPLSLLSVSLSVLPSISFNRISPSITPLPHSHSTTATLYSHCTRTPLPFLLSSDSTDTPLHSTFKSTRTLTALRCIALLCWFDWGDTTGG
jgi:hypothetical protein